MTFVNSTIARIERERQANGHDAPEVEAWGDPDWSLLDDRRGNLPPFPIEALPSSLHDWISRAAHGCGATVAHVAVPLLGIASGLLGTARRVEASRSWTQPATLWCAIVGFSGTGKTPGLDCSRGVVGAIEHIRKTKIADLQREHDSRAQAAKAARKHWEKQVEDAIANGAPPPPKPIEATEVGAFVPPRLCVSDTTVERLAVLLEARPRGMTLIADELSRLFLNMSRYSSGQDNEFWLEAWNGKHYVVERQGRPPVVLDHLLVGVVGGFQPDKLARSFEGDADGMSARILFAWPDEPGYRPLSNEMAEIEPAMQNALARIVDLPAEGDDGAFALKAIPLSSDAVSSFERFRQFLHEGKSELDGREREWWSKGPAHVLRLALTLTYLDWGMRGGAEPQTVDSIDAAVSLWRDYFWPHARAALRQVGLTERHANARRALKWVRARRKPEVSLMDIRREALCQALDGQQTEALLDSLSQAGWLQKHSETTGGRARHRWIVNPALHAGSAGSAGRTAAFSESRLSALPALPAQGAEFLGPPGDSLDDFE